MWFHPSLLKTEALTKIQVNSMPWAESEIRERIRALFIDSGDKEILMSSTIISKEFFKGKYTERYINTILTENIKVNPLTDKNGKLIVKSYEYPRLIQSWIDGELVDKMTYIKHRGRAFQFIRNQFLSKEEDHSIIYEDDMPDNNLNNFPPTPDKIPF
ncbi:hypothetical protein ACFLRY_00920 [Bacteroidota bacterium]